MRIDQYLTTRYGFTRNKAQQLIKNGLISIDGIIRTKTAFEVSDKDTLEIKQDKSIVWVSRSAGKLDGFFEALDSTSRDYHIQDARCLDIGSSTGGFTQVLLEYWAYHVDAVDIGSDQLHASIRNNKKVSSHEKTDIRKFPAPEEPYDIITVDVSFISIEEILPELQRFSDENTEIFLLFKPQFEVGRTNLRKTGVPKSEWVVEKALVSFLVLLWELDYSVLFGEKASVVGEAGNQEYMFFIKKWENTLDI